MTKLKEFRIAAKLSQSQLAKKAGTNVRVLQNYEQGVLRFDRARLDTLIRYCIALNCTISELIDDPEYDDLLKKYEQIKKHSL